MFFIKFLAYNIDMVYCKEVYHLLTFKYSADKSVPPEISAVSDSLSHTFTKFYEVT